MYTLSDEQVGYILTDIRRNGVENEDLQYNLLDHICCVLEEEMQPESDFHLVYQTILPRFFSNNLREIQEETDLLLTFKHYYAMKKVMLKSGLTSASIFLVGAILKLAHLPGAGISIFVATILFSFLFLPIFFVIKAKEVKQKREIIVIGTGVLFGILFCVSAVFKIMHWPGATLLWRFALAELFFLFLPLFFFHGVRNSETKSNTVIASIMILMVGGMLFTLTNLRSSEWLEKGKLTSHQELLSLSNQPVLRDSNHQVEMEEKLAVLAHIDRMKFAICRRFSPDVKAKVWTELEVVSYYGDNYDVAGDFLFNQNEQPIGLMKELKTKLKLLEKKSKSQQAYFAHASMDQWLKSNFYNLPVELVFRNLSLLKIQLKSF